jgi:hypothetical protein
MLRVIAVRLTKKAVMSDETSTTSTDKSRRRTTAGRNRLRREVGRPHEDARTDVCRLREGSETAR